MHGAQYLHCNTISSVLSICIGKFKLKILFLIEFILLFLGSSPNGYDIVASKSVGVTNHIAIHGLHLNNGHKYYASITGKC